jgi:hypothetical protein
MAANISGAGEPNLVSVFLYMLKSAAKLGHAVWTTHHEGMERYRAY